MKTYPGGFGLPGFFIRHHERSGYRLSLLKGVLSMSAMEAYNEAFGETSEVTSGEMDASPDLVSLIDKRIEAKLDPIKKLAIQLVKDIDELNDAVDKSYAWGSDVNAQIAALRLMVANTQRNRLLFQHHLVMFQHA
jgi:hypothetical protein